MTRWTTRNRLSRQFVPLALFLACCVALPRVANAAKKEKSVAAADSSGVDLFVTQLICDPRVRDELKLSAREAAAIDAAFQAIERPLWLVRDAGGGESAARKRELLSSFVVKLESLLQPDQRARLAQLVLRSRGWSALAAADVSQQISLSAEQTRRVAAIVSSTADESRKLLETSSKAAEREAILLQLRTREGTSIQKVLTSPQRQTLAEMVGAPYDLSTVRPLAFAAPPLGKVDRWINSPPLDAAALRGKVVAFHFWAFNCGNCVQNLPHYNLWQRKFADRGLVVLGMHTPETAAERVPEALQSKVEQYEIRYPVASDHENQNWSAWANSVWPAVYLVDKRGRVRYWWYGELNWQGASGEETMRKRIEDLLAESATAP